MNELSTLVGGVSRHCLKGFTLDASQPICTGMVLPLLFIAILLCLAFELFRTPRSDRPRILKKYLAFAVFALAVVLGVELGGQLDLCVRYGFEPVWTGRISFVTTNPLIRLSNGDTLPYDTLGFLFRWVVGLGLIVVPAMKIYEAVTRRFAPSFFEAAFPKAANSGPSPKKNAP